MGGITIVTLYFGFSRLVDIIGSIGPVVSILAIILGFAGIAMHPEGISTLANQVPTLVESGKILQAGENWFMAVISYEMEKC